MKTFFSILIISVLFAACAKENSDDFYPYPITALKDTVWSNPVPLSAPVHRLMENIAFPPKLDSFNVSAGANIRVSEFLQVLIPPFAFAGSAGSTVTGNVKVEIVHLRKKGDLVRFSKPTTSLGRLFHTGGVFFIRAIKDGQELSLAPNAAIKLKFMDPAPSNDMRVLYGAENVMPPFPAGTNPEFTWVPANDSSRISTYQQQDTFGNIVRGYEMVSKRFRWLAAGVFLDTLQTPRTRLDVLLPLNYTNANTTVFAVFATDRVVVKLNPDINSRSFNTFQLPVGRNINIVSLSKIGDAFYMSVKPVVVTSNLAVSLQPELKTLSQ